MAAAWSGGGSSVCLGTVLSITVYNQSLSMDRNFSLKLTLHPDGLQQARAGSHNRGGWQASAEHRTIRQEPFVSPQARSPSCGDRVVMANNETLFRQPLCFDWLFDVPGLSELCVRTKTGAVTQAPGSW